MAIAMEVNNKRYSLLSRYTDGVECSLESSYAHDFDIFVESKNVAPITGELDGGVSEYEIYVEANQLQNAIALLDAKPGSVDEDFQLYKATAKKKGLLATTLFAFGAAIFFGIISVMASDSSQQGGSLIFGVASALWFFVSLWLLCLIFKDRR